MDDYESYMDESFEIDSALGSAGMGTEEYYRPGMDIDSMLPNEEVE